MQFNLFSTRQAQKSQIFISDSDGVHLFDGRFRIDCHERSSSQFASRLRPDSGRIPLVTSVATTTDDSDRDDVSPHDRGGSILSDPASCSQSESIRSTPPTSGSRSQPKSEHRSQRECQLDSPRF